MPAVSPRARRLRWLNCQLPMALAAFVGIAASGVVAVSVQAQTLDILTGDRLVEHTSTVPAIKGESVSLFVRERIASTILEQPAGP